MSAGGLLMFPWVCLAHPVQHHLRDETAVGLAETRAGAPDYVPEFLDAHQLETLRILAERIVPGIDEGELRLPSSISCWRWQPGRAARISQASAPWRSSPSSTPARRGRG